MINVSAAGMVFTIIMSLAGQTISLIGITYIYTWLYNSTQSVFLAILFHALGNVMTAVFSTDIQPPVGLMIAAMPWVIVFILEKVYGKTRFPGQPT
jgi:membrane protease YdiL (CAAX protease family)